MNKILILIPANNARGGITNYYKILKKYFSNKVVYQYRGARNFPYRKGALHEYIRLFNDFAIFIVKLFDSNLKVIQTTTSLNPNAVKRDAVFILLAKLFKKKVIVFFRGWDLDYAEKIQESKLLKKIYFKADACIVLTRYAKTSLGKWGYKKKIYFGSTAVEDEMVSNLDKEKLFVKYENTKRTINLLFLARIEKGKGIYELIESFEILNSKYENFHLTIAGDGTEELKLKEYVETKRLSKVDFKGFVSGSSKVQLFSESHLFIFPSYTEGMPTSVLEAMAFGLPVVTTEVGALIDFFKNGQNGYMSKLPPNPSKIVSDIEHLILDKRLMKQISLNNYLYAKKHFLASQVAINNEEIFQEILNSKKDDK